MDISGFVYVLGAIGFEMVGGWYFEAHNDKPDLVYELITMVEESLEMIGLVTFIYALMVYITEIQNGLIGSAAAEGSPSLETQSTSRKEQ
jgi:hypothetical protein